MVDHYSAVRIDKLSYAKVVSMSRHAAGLDKASKGRRREGAGDARSIAMAWQPRDGDRGALSRPGIAMLGDDPMYGPLFAWWKQSQGVAQRKGAPVAMHCVCALTPEAIPGARHDPNNPAVRKFLQDCVAWAEREYGKDCVWAARYDVDEKGSAAADLMVSPHHAYRIGKAQPRERIAIETALKDSRRRWKQRTSFAAAQDSFNLHMREAGWDVLRGRPVTETHRRHVTPEVHKSAIGKELAECEKALDRREEAIAGTESALEAKNARHRSHWQERMAELDAKADKIAKDSDLLLEAHEQFKAQRRELEAERVELDKDRRQLLLDRDALDARFGSVEEERLRRLAAEGKAKKLQREVDSYKIAERARRAEEEEARKARRERENAADERILEAEAKHKREAEEKAKAKKRVVFQPKNRRREGRT